MLATPAAAAKANLASVSAKTDSADLTGPTPRHSEADILAAREGRNSEQCRRATAQVLLPGGRMGFWLVLAISVWATVAIATATGLR